MAGSRNRSRASHAALVALVGCAAGLPGCVDDWCDRFSIACDDGAIPERAIVDRDGDVWSEDVDCDDLDPSINPGADEVCDGADNDCDGDVDEGTPGVRTFYEDQDNDRFGNPARSIRGCDVPGGWVDNALDCDDTNARVHPDAPEICDELDRDDDCDGLSDDADPSITYTMADPVCFRDADGDGFGNPDVETGQYCDPDAPGLPAMVLNSADCDDADAEVHPGAVERWYDGYDHDCDGGDDFDADGDGAWPVAVGGDDCDDGDGLVFPGADEVCDGVDHDCDGLLCDQVDLAIARGTVVGTRSQDAVGGALAHADVDGDGDEDFVLGVTGAGRVVAFDTMDGGALTIDDAPVSVESGSDLWSFGAALSAGRDVALGDGYGDLVVGAPDWDTAGTGAGAVFLFAGPVTGAAGLDGPLAVITSVSAATALGDAVLVAQDLTGDGLADLLVGAPELDATDTNAGGVFLFAGPLSGDVTLLDSLMLAGESATDAAGASLDVPGDVDGDGIDDLVVGAWGSDHAGLNAGAIHVLLGPITDHALLAGADTVLFGDLAGDRTGAALAGPGDLDGDGLADILVGAPEAGPLRQGAVYLVAAPALGRASIRTATARIVGEQGSERAGESLAAGGDLDGDGLADMVVGAPSHEVEGVEPGAAYVYGGPWSGSLSLGRSTVQLVGDGNLDQAGAGLLVLPGSDGDGFDDLVVGAPGHDTTATSTGEASFVAGASW